MKTIKNELLKNTAEFKAVREADLIIAYLGDPDGEHKISLQQQTKLDRYMLINQLRMRYKTHKYIIGILKEKGRNERQARYDIAEAEYVFGTAINVSRQYELSYLLEVSRENIRLAKLSKDTAKISKAIETHHKLLGPEVDESQLPDFSKFEQHNYNMILPKEILPVLQQMIASGALNLSEVMPPSMLQIKANNDAQT